jgi:adenylosuccinate lyase
VLWHERDLSNSSAERFTIPHVFIILDEMLMKTERIFSGLEIHADQMKKNIESSRGLIMAEPMMMKLTEKGIGRQEAHEIVRSASMTAIEKGIGLKEALLEKSEVKKVMTEKEMDSAMNPANYIGGAKEIVDKMVSAVEEVLDRKV